MSYKGREFNIDETLARIVAKSTEILERFAEAYLAETGIKPSEIEMCQQNKGNEIVFFFRKKNNPAYQSALKRIEALKAKNDVMREALKKYVELEKEFLSKGGLFNPELMSAERLGNPLAIARQALENLPQGSTVTIRGDAE